MFNLYSGTFFALCAAILYLKFSPNEAMIPAIRQAVIRGAPTIARQAVKESAKKVMQSATRNVNKMHVSRPRTGEVKLSFVQKSSSPITVSQFRIMMKEYGTLARETLREQWKVVPENVKVVKGHLKEVKSKMLFGLDKLPEGAHQHAHFPSALSDKMGKNAENVVSKAIQNLGTKMYNGIWIMSNKMKALPPKTAAALFIIFGYAEIYHTRDEWSQATLTALISPESVGFSLPRTMEEFKEGLVNAALDILPDFAFAVPVAMFLANPPAAILWAGWMAVGEYFAKKAWSLTLRDRVLETENGIKFKEMLEKHKVPAGLVFKKDGKEDGDDDQQQTAQNEEIMEDKLVDTLNVDGEESDGEVNEGKKEMVPILDALSDSQVDSNLYQYLFMNTLRAYYVTATSIYSCVMGEIEAAKKDNVEMTDFAQKMDKTMTENEKKVDKDIMRTPKTIINTNTDDGTDMTPEALAQGYMKVNREPLGTEFLETMDRINGAMLSEMEPDEREATQGLAKQIARIMVRKNEQTNDKDMQTMDEQTNFIDMQTMATIISELSTSPGALEEMVKVKRASISNDPMPMCDEDGKKAFAFGETDHFPICDAHKLVQSNATIEFLSVLEEKGMKDLGKLFNEKVKETMTKANVVGLLKKNVANNGKNGTADEAELNRTTLNDIAGTATNVNKAAEQLKKGGEKNRSRKRFTFSLRMPMQNVLPISHISAQKEGLAQF